MTAKSKVEKAKTKAKADAEAEELAKVKAEEDARAQAKIEEEAKAEVKAEAEADAKLHHVVPKASIVCKRGVITGGKPIVPADIHSDPKVAKVNFDALVEKGLIEKPKKS